ncbi:MAG: RNA methyltransferase [Candidatus Micrarchaeota archaeon]|nr:RNA methyltransferase [Candidatus Micrarchaeota archaeon]
MIRVVLVEPEHGMNIGACARAMKNFGFTDLMIVNPKADHLGRDAMMYSKHAREVLTGAKVAGTLSAATADCDFVIGTTGIARGVDTLKEPITPRQLSARLRKRRAKCAVVFGREGTGLSGDEIKECDFVVSIPTSKKYPVMNLSHALAVILYELRAEGGFPRQPAGAREKEELMRTFSEITDRVAGSMRNPEKSKLAFRRVIGRSLASEIEVSALLCVMKKIMKKWKKAVGGPKLRA